MSSIIIKPVSPDQVALPKVGYVNTFFDSSDEGKLKYKRSDGAVIPVAGDTNINNTEIINAITLPPSYLPPSSEITDVSGMYEIGSSVSINISQSFTQNDGGVKTAEKITKNGSEVSNENSYNENLVIPVGTLRYSGVTYYAEGACKMNNLGKEDCSGRIASGVVSAENRIIKGIYPIF